MQAHSTAIPGVVVFEPTPHHDDRGFFTRTFDAAVAAEHGIDAASFIQDSQSRSHLGVVRGLHGRRGRGESKLVRCARGAVYDVVVDARPDSPTFGEWLSFQLDDTDFRHLYIPSGLLHGFQVLTETADICYRIDRGHDPAEDLAIRYDDVHLSIAWPLPVTKISERDARAGSWTSFCATLEAAPTRL